MGDVLYEVKKTEVQTLVSALKGQSHEKVGEMSVWGISLAPN
jgi:hypothetical protein